MSERVPVVVCLIVALAFALSVSGCEWAPGSNQPSKAAKPPVPVPDVVGKTTTQALDALDSALGSTVTVEVYSATRHGTIKVEEPDSRRSTESTVTSQAPAAGALIEAGASIRIVVGTTPSGDGVPEWAGFGWFYHPTNVKKNGADPCFACHQPTDCADCHTKLAGEGVLGGGTGETGAGGASHRQQRESSALEKVARRSFGTGSKTREGVREVLFSSNVEGGYFTVVVTASQFSSERAVREAFDAAAKRFTTALRKNEEFESLQLVRIAWFQSGATTPAVVMTCRRRSASSAFNVVVEPDYDYFDRFVDSGR